MWCVAPLEMNEGTHLGVRVQSAFGSGAEIGPTKQRYLLVSFLQTLLQKFSIGLSSLKFDLWADLFSVFLLSVM